MAEWVWSRFYPGSQALCEELKAEHGAKLLRKLDANGDGLMDFDEFQGWFKRTCAVLKRQEAATVNGASLYETRAQRANLPTNVPAAASAAAKQPNRATIKPTANVAKDTAVKAAARREGQKQASKQSKNAELVFDQIDKDADGKLTEREFAAWAELNQQKAGEFFGFLDKNDFENGGAASFKDKTGVFWLKAVMEFDDNVDMKLDKTEFCSLYARLANVNTKSTEEATAAKKEAEEVAAKTAEANKPAHRKKPGRKQPASSNKPDDTPGWFR